MSIGTDKALPPAKDVRVWQCPVRVIKVTDADTISVDIAMSPRLVVHKEGLRIYGVDTPESSFRATKNPQEVEVGKLVKKVVKNWVYSRASEPYANIDGKDFCYAAEFSNYDKYHGRLGVHFYGRTQRGRVESLSQFLIENNLAFPYFGETKQEWTEESLQITAEAAQELLGHED